MEIGPAVVAVVPCGLEAALVKPETVRGTLAGGESWKRNKDFVHFLLTKSVLILKDLGKLSIGVRNNPNIFDLYVQKSVRTIVDLSCTFLTLTNSKKAPALSPSSQSPFASHF